MPPIKPRATHTRPSSVLCPVGQRFARSERVCGKSRVRTDERRRSADRVSRGSRAGWVASFSVARVCRRHLRALAAIQGIRWSRFAIRCCEIFNCSVRKIGNSRTLEPPRYSESAKIPATRGGDNTERKWITKTNEDRPRLATRLPSCKLQRVRRARVASTLTTAD